MSITVETNHESHAQTHQTGSGERPEGAVMSWEGGNY